MSAIFRYNAGFVLVTPSSDVPAGGIIAMTNRLAVAPILIAAGELGAAATEGIFEVPVTTNKSFAQDAKVYIDTSTGKATDDNTKAYAGLAVAASAAGTVLVDLNAK